MSQEQGMSVSKRAALCGGGAALAVTAATGLGLYAVEHMAAAKEQRIEWDLAHGGLYEWTNSGRLTVEIDPSVNNLLADAVQVEAVIRDVDGCDIRIQDWDSMVDQGAHVGIPVALSEVESNDGKSDWWLVELVDYGGDGEGEILVRRGEPLNQDAIAQIVATNCEFDGQTLSNVSTSQGQ